MKKVPRPPEPTLDSFKYGDIVERNGQQGMIHDMSTNHTCTVDFLPIKAGDDYRNDAKWPLAECKIIGKWTGKVELFEEQG